MNTESQVARYTRLLKQHGPTFQAAEWGSEESQLRRFRVIVDGLLPRARTESLLDVGCGLGDLSVEVRLRSGGSVVYDGWDVTPAMVEAAAQRYPYNGTFRVRDVLSWESSEQYDWVVTSGLFTHNDREFFDAAIQRMWALCRRGIIFNSLSVWGENPVPGEYQSDPARTLMYCRTKCSSKVVLRHDYLLHDFTVYCYR